MAHQPRLVKGGGGRVRMNGWEEGRRGVGNWRDIPGKMIIRSWKNFWHEKKRKGGDRRNAEPPPPPPRNVTVIGSFIARL